MKIINNKYWYSLALLLCTILSFAQQGPPDPGGGTGGVGPGARASSIDLYSIYLLIIALVFAGYFAKNYMKKIAK